MVETYFVYDPVLATSKLYSLEELVKIASGPDVVVPSKPNSDPKKGPVVSTGPRISISNNKQASAELISQLVFILCDISGSMGSRTSIKGFNRLEVAQAYFILFSDKLQAIAKSIKIGLIVFDHEIIVQKDLRDYAADFQNSLDGVKARGGTAIYKAIFKAISLLAGAKKGYPNAQLRIILLTDGGDNNGGVTPYNLLKLLSQHNILLDSFFVADDFDAQAVALTRLAGGCPYYFKDPYQTAKEFQRDELIDLSRRKYEIPKVAPSENILKQNAGKFNDLLNEGLEVKQLPTLSAIGKFNTPRKILVEESNKSLKPIPQPSPSVPKKDLPLPARLLKELHLIHNQKLDYLAVFPNVENFNIWKVFLLGPDGSPYSKRWFYLSASFSQFYPNQCPSISFVLPPYHMNISDLGTICLDILGEGYDPHYHVLDLFNKIRTLLANPRSDTPIDFERNFLTPKQFQDQIKVFNQNNSKTKYQEWFVGNPPDYPIDNSEGNIILLAPPFIPLELRCPISKLKIQDPVRASTGVIYDRIPLEQRLSQSLNPVCVVTGKKFTEQDKHLPTDVEVQKRLRPYLDIVDDDDEE